MKILYVKHPIDADAKTKIRADNPGCKIIDARFAPANVEIYGETPLLDQAEKPAPKKRGRQKKKAD